MDTSSTVSFCYCLKRFGLGALTNHTNCLDSTSQHYSTQVRRLSGQQEVSIYLRNLQAADLEAELNAALKFSIVIIITLKEYFGIAAVVCSRLITGSQQQNLKTPDSCQMLLPMLQTVAELHDAAAAEGEGTENLTQ